MLKSTLIKLHAATTLFAERGGCSAKELADLLNVPVNSIYHYAKHPEWNESLDLLGYTGERAFHKETRDVIKESGELVAQAHAIYHKARTDGQNHKRAVSVVCETPSLKRRRVNYWAKRFDWQAQL